MPTLSQRLKNLLFAVGVIIADYFAPYLSNSLLGSFVMDLNVITLMGTISVLVMGYWVAKKIPISSLTGFWIFMGWMLFNKLFNIGVITFRLHRDFPPTSPVYEAFFYLYFIAAAIFLILAFRTELTEVSFDESSNTLDIQSGSKESSISKLEPEIQDIVGKIRNRPFPGEHQF